jgi:hypothetical protein
MDFSFSTGIPILQRTPAAVRAMLDGLPLEWIGATEGHGTWSPFDIVGHLIHAERADWIPRVEHILAHGDTVAFPPFDREAMFEASKGQTLAQLLDTFAVERRTSLDRLHRLALTPADLERRGRHPAFGIVHLRQHLATWVAHDCTHISQIARVLAHQYRDAVGPWREYLSILNR